MAERLTRSEQQGRTRAALLDAAGAVFVERGFQGASVEAIAERAGFTRGAFYSNFASKDELFAELLQERVYAGYRAMAAAAAEEPPTPRQSGELLAARWLEAPAAFGARLHLGTAAICVLGWERDVRVIDRWNQT